MSLPKKKSKATKRVVNPPTVDSPLLDEESASAYLGVSRSTLIRRRRLGDVQYTRIGNLVYYTRPQLDKFIESCALVDVTE